MPSYASKMTRYRVVSVGGLVCLSIAASMALAKNHAIEVQTARNSPAPGLPMAPPSASQTASHVPDEYLGVLVARLSADIAPRFQGRALDVLVRLGDPVKTGDIIAIVDSPSLRHDLRIAEASLGTVTVDQSRALVELSEAEEKLARRKALAAEALTSTEDLSAARYQQQLATARVASARAQLAERRANVDRLRQDNADAVLRAPFEGIVAGRYVDPGATVFPSTPIARIISAHDVFLRFAIPERIGPTMSVGRNVTAFVGERRMQIIGTIDKIAPEVDVASHMIFVEAHLPKLDPDSFALVGEMARVVLDPPLPPP